MSNISLDLPESNTVLIRGQKLPNDIYKMVSSITLTAGTTQVTELAITIEDPGFSLLRNKFLDVDTPIQYGNHNLLVSVIEITDGGGQGGLVIRCRPVTVKKLKALQTPQIRNKLSRSSWAIAEFKLVGAPYLVDPYTIVTETLMREVTTNPAYVDLSEIKSAWTTLQTFAEESRFLFFEHEGYMFFGDPHYIVDHLPKVIVDCYDKNGKRMLNDNQFMSIPKFRRSTDTRDVDVTVDLPLSRADECKIGRGIVFNGMPYFAGTYMITEISYPLIGGGVINVTASTVRSPYPQISPDSPSSIWDGLTRIGSNQPINSPTSSGMIPGK